MKKLLVVIVVVFSSCLGVHSQSKGTFEGGFFAALNPSSVRTSQEAGGVKSGVSIGASGEYYFSDSWGLYFELAFTQKGWADGFFADESGMYTTDYRLNYITIPITASWHFGRTKGWHLNFGPYIGFLTKAEVEYNGMEVSDFMTSTDFGLAFGIGYKFRLNEFTRLQLEYGTQTGFVNIFETSDTDIYNSSSRFTLGLLFDL